MLRRDCDDDSPRDEIEYWKTRSTRLNLLQEQVNDVRVVQVGRFFGFLPSFI